MEPIIQCGNIHTGPRKRLRLNIPAPDPVSFNVNEPHTNTHIPHSLNYGFNKISNLIIIIINIIALSMRSFEAVRLCVVRFLKVSATQGGGSQRLSQYGGLPMCHGRNGAYREGSNDFNSKNLLPKL